MAPQGLLTLRVRTPDGTHPQSIEIPSTHNFNDLKDVLWPICDVTPPEIEVHVAAQRHTVPAGDGMRTLSDLQINDKDLLLVSRRPLSSSTTSTSASVPSAPRPTSAASLGSSSSSSLSGSASILPSKSQSMSQSVKARLDVAHLMAPPLKDVRRSSTSSVGRPVQAGPPISAVRAHISSRGGKDEEKGKRPGRPDSDDEPAKKFRKKGEKVPSTTSSGKSSKGEAMRSSSADANPNKGGTKQKKRRNIITSIPLINERTTPKFFVPPPPRVITEDPYETSLDVIEAELWDQLYAFQWYPTKFADDETTFGVVQDKA